MQPRKNGQFVLQGVINVANETTVNLLVADRLHLYNGLRLTPVNLAEITAGLREAMGEPTKHEQRIGKHRDDVPV